MLSHVTVGSNDIPRSRTFYDHVTAALGLACLHQSPGSLGYGRQGRGAQLWIVRPLDKKAATNGNGITIGLQADTRAAVDAAYAAAIAHGGTDEGTPGLRPHYHPSYYGAYVRDPDGNKLCMVCHTPA
jgi:catechol 2,3-dioxygenase-like lactoylglutathione lyase family enzyme